MACTFNRRTLSLLLLLVIAASGNCLAKRTYTTNADFEEGILQAVQDVSIANQLQLDPFIWVPNYDGTISKVGTGSGKEFGRYRVVPSNLPPLPSGLPNFGFPSATAVATDGSCWVGNRTAGTVVKIGLLEEGQWIERNGIPGVQTSRDLNNDGVITGGEVLPWGEDECVLYEVVLPSGVPGVIPGTYTPGAYAGVYDDDDERTSPRALALDSGNELWVGSWGLGKYFHITGATTSGPPSGVVIDRTVDVGLSPWFHTPFGAVTDRFGAIWSAGRDGLDLLRIDVSTDPASLCNVILPHLATGLALDYLDHLFVTGYSQSQLSRIDITKCGQVALDWTRALSGLLGSRGAVCTTKDNDVWVANAFADTVTRYDNEGNLKASIVVGSSPTGMAVDTDGKVWVGDYMDEDIRRIDPATNAVDLTKLLPGTIGHYSYGGMTGLTANSGVWTVDYDSGKAATAWGAVSWNNHPGGLPDDPNNGVPPGSTLTVAVQSSEDKITFSPAETAGNGVPLTPTLVGRYLRVVVRFNRAPGADSPVLYDLTVTPLPEPPIRVSADPATICSRQCTTLTAMGGSGDELRWSTTCHGAVLGTGASILVCPTSATTYYAWWHHDAGDSNCADAAVTVNPLPEPPSSVSADPPTICPGACTTLTATGGSGDELRWSTNCHGTVLGTGASISVCPPSTTTYYAWWHNGCGDSNCASVTVYVSCRRKLLQAYCGLTCPGVGNQTFEGYRGLGKDTITAVPGVFAIDPGTNWANFVAAAVAGVPYGVTSVSMRKIVPVYVCTAPIGGKAQLQQGSANIRKWWPLMYELPGTKWTLTIWYKTAKWDDDGIGPNPPATIHQSVWTWEVDATLDSLEGLVRLFHELPAGSCQVPLINGNSLYESLRDMIAQLKILEADVSNPDWAQNLSDAMLEFILFVEDNCLTVECGACVSESGIRNTMENPACCKILADADYIAQALRVFRQASTDIAPEKAKNRY